jgi:hypothetical protein
MLDVFITIDTEAWPRDPDWRATAMRRDIDVDIYGETSEGRFGIGYQMDVFEEHGLKAVFFVEALFACAVGLSPLRDLVAMIRGRGHEVQLHLHTEWLAWMESPVLPGRTGQNMKDFTEDEQALLIARGLENLEACGAGRVCAFRAGNYGADFATLRALARNGILYDTSHNAAYLDAECGLRTPDAFLQPRWLEGVHEFPISSFRDWPGHDRHAQLCACTERELEFALMEAWRRGWFSFVLVSHSFELLRGRKKPGRAPTADRIVIRRFEHLCRFLSEHRDKFRTSGFSEIDPDLIPSTGRPSPLRSSVHRTMGRFVEQLARRIG